MDTVQPPSGLSRHPLGQLFVRRYHDSSSAHGRQGQSRLLMTSLRILSGGEIQLRLPPSTQAVYLAARWLANYTATVVTHSWKTLAAIRATWRSSHPQGSQPIRCIPANNLLASNVTFAPFFFHTGERHRSFLVFSERSYNHGKRFQQADHRCMGATGTQRRLAPGSRSAL